MIRTATLRLSAWRRPGELETRRAHGLPSGPVLAGAAGVLVCAAAFTITAVGSPASSPVLAAAVRTLGVAVPIGVGVFTWHRHPSYAFARLLVAVGFGWSLTVLAESDLGVLYSLGRVAAWLVEPSLLFVLLVFPFAHLHGRPAQGLMLGAVVVVATLYLPTALLVEQYPVPSPYAGCGTDCPQNAFMVTSHQPAVVDSVIRPAREAITALLFLGAVLLLAWRTAHASRSARGVALPVLATASVRLVLFPAFLLARRADPSSDLVDVISWAFALTLPAIALAFLASILRWKLFLAGALERVSSGLADGPSGPGLRRSLAEALEDPPADTGRASPDGTRGAARRLASIVHDPKLSEYPGLLEATGSLAQLALDNDRLAADLRESLRELRASRARIQASADATRLHIERDLHDGAQQHLVTLQMRLELALDLIDGERETSLRLLREAGRDAEQALEEIRSLAHGVYPALLADRGPVDALRSAGRHTPRPVTVQARDVDRYSEEIESAVYFCCLEAIQNATKHAGEDATATVSLHGGDHLRFEVRDDGQGFDPGAANGTAGLTNMRDRIEAIGGTLAIDSAPGAGTVVRGAVPARPRAAARQ